MSVTFVCVDGQPITGPVTWPQATAIARALLRRTPGLQRGQITFE